VNAAVSESDVLRGADQTRLRILAATRALYASRGTKGTTTREVAISAGVNEATLFRHFGTKQQLVDAMLEYYGRLETPWQSLSHLTAYPTIEEQLGALGTSAIESMLRKQDLMRMTMAEELTNPGGTSCAWQAPSEARRVLVEFFENKIASGELRGEAEFLACSFMSFFYAYVMARKIWGAYDRPADHVVTSIVELFLNGART
jgi:AcrR family transcriptional regulator